MRSAVMPAPGETPVICHVAYKVDVTKLDAFETYAAAWVKLIERHGGRHFGFFVATSPPASAPLSFPGIGRAGDLDVAIAMFSFPDAEAYERYRTDVREDPECRIAEEVQTAEQCFASYARTFLRRIA